MVNYLYLFNLYFNLWFVFLHASVQQCYYHIKIEKKEKKEKLWCR